MNTLTKKLGTNPTTVVPNKDKSQYLPSGHRYSNAENRILDRYVKIYTGNFEAIRSDMFKELNILSKVENDGRLREPSRAISQFYARRKILENQTTPKTKTRTSSCLGWSDIELAKFKEMYYKRCSWVTITRKMTGRSEAALKKKAATLKWKLPKGHKRKSTYAKRVVVINKTLQSKTPQTPVVEDKAFDDMSLVELKDMYNKYHTMKKTLATLSL